MRHEDFKPTLVKEDDFEYRLSCIEDWILIFISYPKSVREFGITLNGKQYFPRKLYSFEDYVRWSKIDGRYKQY